MKYSDTYLQELERKLGNIERYASSGTLIHKVSTLRAYLAFYFVAKEQNYLNKDRIDFTYKIVTNEIEPFLKEYVNG